VFLSGEGNVLSYPSKRIRLCNALAYGSTPFILTDSEILGKEKVVGGGICNPP
jgi:hypothetical protein